MKSRLWLTIVSCSLALIAIGLIGWWVSPTAQARPELSPVGVTRYVSLAGNDNLNTCTSSLAPCRTVQHTIEQSQAGDEVHVAQGTYAGTMTAPGSVGPFSATVVLTKNLFALLGGYSSDFSTRSPDVNTTVLSASDSPRKFVVYISNTTTLVDGFTLTGATGACPTDCVVFQYIGGAVYIRGGAPTISHNRIQGNRAFYYGGGIAVAQYATPVIVSNVIYSNTASYVDAGGLGGGIYIGSGSAVITGNVIISNVADVEGGGLWINGTANVISNVIAYNSAISTTAGRGGGLRAVGDSFVTISHNDVYSNTAASGGGGGIDVSSPASVDGNYIHHNTAPWWGGALFANDSAQPITLTNNVVVRNYGTGITANAVHDVYIINNVAAYNVFASVGSPGAGIQAGNYGVTPTEPMTATMLNNVLIGNADCGINSYNLQAVTVDFNDSYNNKYDYCELAWPNTGTHGIYTDPQFVNTTSGDYHVHFGSPAMNAGTNLAAPAYDRDGVKRPQMGRVDMGAYEVVAPHSVYLPTVLK